MAFLKKIDSEKSQRNDLARSLIAERNEKAKNDTREQKPTFSGGLGKSSDAMTALLNHSMADFKVDGKNTPYRWKDRRRLELELSKKGSLSKSKRKEPSPFETPKTRAFPEELRSTTADNKVRNGNSVQIVYESKQLPEDALAISLTSANQSGFLDDKDFLRMDDSTLPLDQFDNGEFDPLGDEWWLSITKKAMARYYINGVWKWRPCEVVDYNFESRRFTIKFRGSNKTKQLKRLNLMFDGESKENYEARVAAAEKEREKAKAALRFDHYIASQSDDTITPMMQSTLEAIHAKVIDGLVQAASPMNHDGTLNTGSPQASLMRSLTAAAIHDYSRSMKKAVLFYSLKYEDGCMQHYKSLKLPVPSFEVNIPTFGKLQIPEHAFGENRAHLTNAHYTSRVEVLDSLLWLHELWDVMLVNTKFVTTDEGKSFKTPCQLSQFKKVQEIHCAQVQDKLAVEWRRGISERLVDNVQDVYDFFESNMDVHSESPLARLLKAVEVRMQTELRSIGKDTVEALVGFVEKHTIAKQCVGPQSGEMREASMPIPVCGTPPLFEVTIVSQKTFEVEFEPSMDDIEAVLLSSLDSLVASTRTFYRIDHELMSLLNLDEIPIFNLGANDPLVASADKHIAESRAKICEMLATSFEEPLKLLEGYRQYAYLLKINPKDYAKQFFGREAPPSREDIDLEANKFTDAAHQINLLSHDTEHYRIAILSCEGIKNALSSRANAIVMAIMAHMAKRCKSQNNRITSDYKGMLARIHEKPQNEVELQRLMDYIQANKVTVANIKQEVDEIHAHLDVAAKYHYRLPKDEFDLAWSTKEWPREIQFASDNCDSALEEDKERMMNDLYRERNQFELDLDKYEAEVAGFKKYGEILNTEKYSQLAYDMQSTLQECRAAAENFNMREKVFGQQPTDYLRLDSMEKDFGPYLKLWTMCDKFKENTSLWLSGPLLELEYTSIEKEVTDWFKTSYRLNKQLLEEAPGSAEVAMALRENTAEFRKNLPVIKSLASNALRDRHWLQLTATLNEAMSHGKEGDDIPEKINLDPDDDLTLQMLLDLNVSEHLEVIQQVCAVAEKEFQLEKNLNAMIQDWAPIQFECKAYKNGETYLIGGTDDIISLLDDQIVKVQTMRGSPYIKPIEKECKRWEKTLAYGQQLVDEWIQCQRTYMYLEPIFNSEDIMRQMPKEALRFATVDKMWKKTMQETFAEPSFMECCNRDKLLSNFQIANEKLDQIQKGLNDYLEVKRIAFPRFFFLSNDELLEILSQTKDPLMVQPHLGKCFEGMNKVIFQKDLKITHMKSAEGEVVSLSDVVDPESNKNKGNVELWLLEVEDYHWTSIQQLVKKGLQMYSTMKRTDFALSDEVCAQVVLVVTQTFWTKEVEASIMEGKLAEYNKNYYGHLEDIVQLVKGKVSKLNRKTLGALTVMDVHAYETVGDMVLKDVNRKDQFEWMSQLRYYYAENDDPKTQKALPEKIIACIVNARIAYGYEYLGNSMRLVITPLTDRCYRTMMGAVDLLYGGAPEGPAGTGKTETVKDLAKAVAIQCVVFNCSDGLDYLAMAKFFKGLAASGAWCCFDEFNRINIEVLSVIAQQILTITEGKVKKLDKFHFEGSFIKLNPRANAFITMNPGYAGRAELPDNLKALFRPCAMMVPDYAMISEIRLISFGYTHAKINAQKLVRVLSLCSEQLSSQKHYDYGMRAVNSIIVACGNLRQQLGDDPQWSEEKIVLRSVNDVNLPKFTNEDLPLFAGITSDLFPGVELPKADYGDLIPTLEETCERGITICPGEKIYLKPKSEYIRKCIQLYETVQVRHGMMVVGAAFSGKTCIFHTLAEAMSLCSERGNKQFSPVEIFTMNPKSIKQGQLYGNFDENTHEWSDGILAVIYRNCSKDESEVLQWIIFDGPVDAVWIENMNTVLDDNKKLCLMSGEIVKMTDRMRMMFEPEDLQEASPATVSRVGIVFTQPLNTVGWRVIVQVWTEKTLPENLREHANFIVEMTEWLLPPIIFYALKECVIPTPVTEMEMIASLLRLCDSLLQQWDGQASDVVKVMESTFFFSLIWSVGAVISLGSRQGFHDFFLEMTSGKEDDSPKFQRFLLKNPTYMTRNRSAMLLPGSEGFIYDYKFELKKCTWTHWMDLSSKYVIKKPAAFSSILVPTLDTERQDFVVKTLLQGRYNVLCTGDTGTGKSVSTKKMLLKDLDQEKYAPMFLNFSAQTSANQTQDIIDGKLDKRRKGVLGPPLGITKIIFVDDLNMPAKEEYGAQPPIEILRQWMDHGGWYDLKTNTFNQLIDIQFMAAMGPPGGGRTFITQRYVRHFNVVNFVPFDHSGLANVFQTVADWFLARFSGQIKALGPTIVESSIVLYEKISKCLLPTPSKSHYTFNLRDLSKVFLGICTVGVDTIKNPADMIRLWSHECLRVFYDRLTDNDDRGWFVKEVSKICEDEFKLNYEKKVKGENEILLYGNFVDPRAPLKVYQEVVDQNKLNTVMEEYLLDYNSMCTPMALVLFKNAVEHIARISRILGQPQGNALLVGVGGSGRKSLTKLATFMQDFKIFEIEITKTYGLVEWREDLKKILMVAGGDVEPSVFLFSDTQIVVEGFVEDINGILNTGEVPNLFNDEERAMLFEKVGPMAEAAGINTGNQAEVFNFFVSLCKENLHCVLAFSPIGDAFRTRLRMFPALVNCCTIDWFTEWPAEALRSVAQKFFEEEELTDKLKQGVQEACVDMQNKVSDMSKDYLSKLRRYYYVTPTSYLELINTFKTLLKSQRLEIASQRDRYANGLAKLEDTRQKVGVMQVQLEQLQPELKVAKKETEELLETIKHQQVEAEETKKVVAAEEKVCNAQKADAEELASDCQEKLAKAIPALEAAVKALKTLSKNDIVEVRGMKTPPKAVVLVMEAICIMMSVPPLKIKDPDGGTKKVDDYWGAAKKDLLADVTKFIPSLMMYDKDNIDPIIVEKVKPFTLNPEFQPAVVMKGSVAAAGLCKWVHAMVVYDEVAKIVAPKKAQLKEAESTLAVAKAALEEKQSSLQKIVDKLTKLDEGLQKALKKKQELQDNVDQCAARLIRADQLIGGLGGEQARWTEMVAKLGDVYNNVVGDIVLSSGVIAYLGAFTAGYRTDAIAGWSRLLLSKNIACTENFRLKDTLGEPVKIADWTINKLPNDSFSIDNGIMLFKSNRWPLMIDPQGQANKWIKNMEAPNSLQVIKQSQASFARSVENCLAFGQPCLIENAPEAIDPLLENVLLKRVIGGVIKLGDASVEYNHNFKLYITTSLRNPHYPPETCVKVNLLNFMATQEGLEDQMLGIVVAKENPEMEEKRQMLVIQDADNKRQLKNIEDNILHLLKTSQGEIVDDLVLIDTLQKAKLTSKDIEEKVKEAKKISGAIQETRDGYVPVAYRSSHLFFCIADLASVDPMYQYSMEWYIMLFLSSIETAERGTLQERIANLNKEFTFTLYRNVCRSLFEKDKLLFSFLLCMRIAITEKNLDPTTLRFFLQGNPSIDMQEPNPASGWITDKCWIDFLGTRNVRGLEWLSRHVTESPQVWKAIYNSSDAEGDVKKMVDERGLDSFLRLIILRCIRPDCVVPAVMHYLKIEMGQKFIEPPPFDLLSCYNDSTCSTPLIFVLTPGADPMSELNKLADSMGFGKKLTKISLGQGQGPLAQNAIEEATSTGSWVCLQNCHLAVSWMPTLERLCEDINPENVEETFRLWLTSEPSKSFPPYVLQNGVKMTNEPPKGLRANLNGSYVNLTREFLEDTCVHNGHNRTFQKMLFGLCFFHASLIERLKFGPLGWNIRYVFSVPDLNITRDQLKIFLENLRGPDDNVPYAALAYLAGECNYGGRVTDDKDRRCLNTCLSDFYTGDILDKNYKFSPSGIYFSPEFGRENEEDTIDGHAKALTYIRNLPLNDPPELFGLHDNANISCAIADTNLLLETALSLQPRTSGGAGKSWDETLTDLAFDIESRLPGIFDEEQANLSFPVDYNESMNTVLTQELGRFNKLIVILQKSLKEVQKAIKGLVVMSKELEDMGNSMVNGQVPKMWSKSAYPSLKPLGSWVNDLLQRLQFLQMWIDDLKAPPVFWISGFFFTQAFITGTMQNYARKHKISIDKVGYDMRCLFKAECEKADSEKPEDGSIVRGLFLEGADWNFENGWMAESKPKELFIAMPYIHLMPKDMKNIEKIEDVDVGGTAHVYQCPVYKTSFRQGTLSTTGHSTNFVMYIRLRMSPPVRCKHWVKRGAAMLTQLDD